MIKKSLSLLHNYILCFFKKRNFFRQYFFLFHFFNLTHKIEIKKLKINQSKFILI